MSSNLPLRTIRIPIIQRQCISQQRRHFQPLRAFSTTPQLFASTSPGGKTRKRKDRALARANAIYTVGPAMRASEEEAQGQEDDMQEDIGLLQGTVVRASKDKLPAFWTPQYWSYHWKLLKSKVTGMYSRSVYNQCMAYKGKWRYMPVDIFENIHLKVYAKRLHKLIYDAFADRDTEIIRRFCLTPLAEDFENRIAARVSLNMKWELLEMHSARVVSHRVSMIGDDLPNSGYRQAVVRLVSTQRVTRSSSQPKLRSLPTAAEISARKRSKWVPEEAKGPAQDQALNESEEFMDNGVPKKVVEYMVVQKRMRFGQEDMKWMVWGFTEESTLEKIADDNAHWRKVMESQTAGT